MKQGVMKRIRCFCLLCFVLTISNIVRAQYHPMFMQYGTNLYHFSSIWPQEKVFLHFDNTGYFEGETIWFKAYVVNASNLQRSSSGVLYVDLLSPTGILLQQKKLKIIDGQADGCFVLYDASTQQARAKRGILPYPSGYYEIRAYTQYMLNFDDNIVFSRIFPIFQKPKDEGRYDESKFITIPSEVGNDRPKPEKLDDVNVSFYPEGGHLVDGLPVNMAFKATDSRGYNIDGILRIDGNITEGSVEATTEHDGMGSVRITPTSTKPIEAIFTYQGKEYSVNLPEIERQGYTISVDNTLKDDTLTLRISNNTVHGGEIYYLGLSITCRGKLIYYAQLDLETKVENFVYYIPKVGWPLGVCNLVLFDINGEVLSSRYVFNYNNDFRPTTINVCDFNTDFQPNSKVSFLLQLKDRDGIPFRDRIALSVRDSKEYGTIYSDNLLTNMLLSSDLRGFIKAPEYYFESDDSVHRRHTDLLMQVQGWERYNWKEMSGVSEFAETRRMEKTLGVNGWILENPLIPLPNDKFLKGVEVYSTIVPPYKNLPVEYGRYTTDKTGYFGFDTKDYYGTANLNISIVYKKHLRQRRNLDYKAKIRLERSMTPTLRPIYGTEIMLGEGSSNIKVLETDTDIKDFSVLYDENGILLPEVDIESMREYIDYNTFQAFDVKKDVEMILDLGKYPPDLWGYLYDKGYTTLELLDSAGTGFILNNKPCFLYVHSKNKYIEADDQQFYTSNISRIASVNVSDYSMPMSVLRDEIPLFYKSKEYLFNPTSLMNAYNHYYLIDVQVKEQHQLKSNKEERNLGQRITTLAGYSLPEEFYSPEYPDGPIPGDVDYRRTLYWNPNLVTDSVGRAQVEFYNNSYSTGFSISGTGMTASGTPYIIDETYTKPED